MHPFGGKTKQCAKELSAQVNCSSERPILAQPPLSAEDRFLALSPVHRGALEGQQRVDSGAFEAQHSRSRGLSHNPQFSASNRRCRYLEFRSTQSGRLCRREWKLIGRSSSESSRLQLALEFVEEAPIRVLGDQRLRARLNQADFVQPQCVETQRVLRVGFPPEVLRRRCITLSPIWKRGSYSLSERKRAAR